MSKSDVWDNPRPASSPRKNLDARATGRSQARGLCYSGPHHIGCLMCKRGVDRGLQDGPAPLCELSPRDPPLVRAGGPSRAPGMAGAPGSIGPRHPVLVHLALALPGVRAPLERHPAPPPAGRGPSPATGLPVASGGRARRRSVRPRHDRGRQGTARGRCRSRRARGGSPRGWSADPSVKGLGDPCAPASNRDPLPWRRRVHILTSSRLRGHFSMSPSSIARRKRTASLFFRAWKLGGGPWA